ncbi:hypothetical protein ACFQPA_12530 [Halomarina halobia]|uniref:Uncharacterized protein n=1 Tax=Halomarina halobia TaxID=3033386 RepID=A0ABD6A9U7_9EURY|nr:hypothetical protein [Halomarina sp. PSR21]
MAYRAILPDGDIECSQYQERDHGVELYTDAEEFIAFVPYANLIAVLDEDRIGSDERSIM